MTAPRAAPTYRVDPFDLRLFAAVVEQGSITAGARHGPHHAASWTSCCSR